MIGVPAEDTLVIACERRIGQRVRVASTLHVRRVESPAGRARPCKPERMVIALTDNDLWLLAYRYWVVGFSIGAVLCHWPRRAAVVHWRRRWWTWPSVWRLELSWPARGFYVEGDLMGGLDADLLIGLTTSDDFARAPAEAAAAPR
jgi:hypothetical protein